MGFQIGKAARRVDKPLPQNVVIQRVYGEIPPEGIFLKRCAKAHCARPVCAARAVFLRTEGSIFKRMFAKPDIQRAKKSALFPAGHATRFKQCARLRNRHGGGHVNILHGQAKAGVSHHAAHGIQREARIPKDAGKGR